MTQEKEAEMSNLGLPKYKVNPLFENLCNGDLTAPSSGYPAQNVFRLQPVTQQPISGISSSPSGFGSSPMQRRGPGPSPEHPHAPGYRLLSTVDPQPEVHRQASNAAVSGWMRIPESIPYNTPPGLEYLAPIDQLLVKQEVETIEVSSGSEMFSKYQIKNNLGQNVYRAVQVSRRWGRAGLGEARSFELEILDNLMKNVIYVKSPSACNSCCFPCCTHSLEVSAPPGTVVGYVEQNWSLCNPHFTIRNAAGDSVLRIKGPFCTQSCCGGDVFKVLSKDGLRKGKISKKWPGLGREAFTDADFFGISFPMDLDVRMKAVMLGACFLINNMYFKFEAGSSSSSPVDD